MTRVHAILAWRTWRASASSLAALSCVIRQERKGRLWTRIWAMTGVVLGERLDATSQMHAGGAPGGRWELQIQHEQPAGAAWERYAWMQGQSFWMEHAFHEGKEPVEHGAIPDTCMIGMASSHQPGKPALLFTARLKSRTRNTAPLLSARDITELLDHDLPRKGRSEDDVIGQIRERHTQRQADLDRRREHKIGLVKTLTNYS